MKTISRFLPGIAAFLLCCASLPAQSAENIIDRHIKALGGKKALQAISSVRISGSVTRNAAASQPGDFLWQTQAPGSAYLELRWPDGHLVEACNGRSAWRDDGKEGPRTLSGHEQLRARAVARFRNDRLLTYKKENTKVQLLGRERVGERAVHVIEMTTRTGVRRKLFFDVEKYMLLKEEEEQENGREEILFSDYRTVDGVMEPFRIQIRRMDGTFDLAVTEAKHGAGADNHIFDFPARSGRPLPDLAALLKSVEKNQEELNKIRENYTYTANETEFEMDDKGKLKQKSEEVYEVYYFYGGQVKKLVRKEGRALSETERRKEDERVEKRIKELEKWQKESQERKQKVAAKQSAKGSSTEAKSDDDDDFTIDDFIRISRITNPRRERFRGKEVIVFEFEPNSAYKPKNRAESWVQKMTGMFWVDEAAKQIVRLEARFVDNIKLGGGILASVGKGSEFVFEQDLVNNEVWLPRYMEGHLTARVLLVKGFKIHRIEQFSDYKKFNVETRIQAKPPEPKPD